MAADVTCLSLVEPTAPVSGEVIDALIEAVVLPTDPRARAVVISSLIGEMCAAVEWLHGSDTSPADRADDERASIRRLAAAAHDHRQRMTAVVTSDRAKRGLR